MTRTVCPSFRPAAAGPACGLAVMGLMTGLVLAAGPLAAQSADARPYTIHDQVALDRVSDLQPAPGGEQIAFVRRATDLEANRGRFDVWLVAADGSELRQLTNHEAADTHPRWAPDGQTLYFLSSRGGSSQIWKLSLRGGEATQVTRLPLDVGSFAVSPDGKLLALSMEVFVDCRDLACTADRLQQKADAKATGNLYTSLFIRHWDTWADGRRSHLFVMLADGSGQPVDVMPGMVADSPSKPFGGAEEYTFTPDSRAVVFTAKDASKGDEPWTTNFDLWLAPVDASAAPRNLTADNLAWDTQPQFSPDGKHLLYLAMSRPGYEADRFRLMLRGWPDGATREIAPAWDASPGAVVFAGDGKTLYAVSDWRGNAPLWAIDVASGATRILVEKGNAKDPKVVRSPAAKPAKGAKAAGGDRVVFSHENLTRPADLWLLEADGKSTRQLTQVNRERLAKLQFGEPEQFTFPGWNDETVHAWVVKPANFDPSRKYPVAYLIHGGPQGSFGNDFHFRWNPQVYAAHGYAAVMVDFHGSTGYGQAFTDSIRGDWGGKPLVDLQKGLEATLARYPWMDGERVCALGASYGGYMINWIAGNWPDRFRCLVNHDGTFDERAMSFETEELWFTEWEFGGDAIHHPEGHEKHNPVHHVAKWKTPMLVVHGALDFRIPDTQGMATFTALQRQGIPSMFLHYPDENHWVLKPHNSIQWHETVLGWLDRYTKAE
jgi:dipeptidyl aminopeptidase/acylaminoacyl peptidase